MMHQNFNLYSKLIQNLLTCKPSEEWSLLRRQADLIDFKLIQLMEQVAQRLIRQGDREEATHLHNLARQLYHLLVRDESSQMDESLVESLDQFIKSYLDTPKDQQQGVLEEYRELLGPSLIHRMQEVAQHLADKGDLHSAKQLWGASEVMSRELIKDLQVSAQLLQVKQLPKRPSENAVSPHCSLAF